jgi:hypothetical protein
MLKMLEVKVAAPSLVFYGLRLAPGAANSKMPLPRLQRRFAGALPAPEFST